VSPGEVTGLVVFDCDGVLVDSETIAIRVDAVILEQVGWPLTEAEIVERFVGRPHAFMVAEIEARVGRTLAADWQAEFAPLYEQAFVAELVAIDGIADVLELLARDHPALPICVASSSKHTSIRRSLDLTGLRHHFAEDRIFSTQDVVRGKPDPDVFLHAAATMGVDPARCTVIEDSAHGVAAARAAGMRVLAYTGGVTPAERLAGPGTELFGDMRMLPALIGLQAPDGNGSGR
jgi:HAD superfamily hydrolase (TIGR01509 family)